MPIFAQTNSFGFYFQWLFPIQCLNNANGGGIFQSDHFIKLHVSKCRGWTVLLCCMFDVWALCTWNHLTWCLEGLFSDSIHTNFSFVLMTVNKQRIIRIFS